MKVFKNIDEQLMEIGFIKSEEEGEKENEFGICYKRECKELGYTQRLDIIHKASGRHLIQSYQEGVNSDGFNNVVGLSYKEIKLAMKKYRQLKRKYKWN